MQKQRHQTVQVRDPSNVEFFRGTAAGWRRFSFRYLQADKRDILENYFLEIYLMCYSSSDTNAIAISPKNSKTGHDFLVFFVNRLNDSSSRILRLQRTKGFPFLEANFLSGKTVCQRVLLRLLTPEASSFRLLRKFDQKQKNIRKSDLWQLPAATPLLFDN